MLITSMTTLFTQFALTVLHTYEVLQQIFGVRHSMCQLSNKCSSVHNIKLKVQKTQLCVTNKSDAYKRQILTKQHDLTQWPAEVIYQQNTCGHTHTNHWSARQSLANKDSQWPPTLRLLCPVTQRSAVSSWALHKRTASCTFHIQWSCRRHCYEWTHGRPTHRWDVTGGTRGLLPWWRRTSGGNRLRQWWWKACFVPGLWGGRLLVEEFPIKLVNTDTRRGWTDRWNSADRRHKATPVRSWAARCSNVWPTQCQTDTRSKCAHLCRLQWFGFCCCFCLISQLCLTNI